MEEGPDREGLYKSHQEFGWSLEGNREPLKGSDDQHVFRCQKETFGCEVEAAFQGDIRLLPEWRRKAVGKQRAGLEGL